VPPIGGENTRLRLFRLFIRFKKGRDFKDSIIISTVFWFQLSIFGIFLLFVYLLTDDGNSRLPTGIFLFVVINCIMVFYTYLLDYYRTVTKVWREILEEKLTCIPILFWDEEGLSSSDVIPFSWIKEVQINPVLRDLIREKLGGVDCDGLQLYVIDIPSAVQVSFRTGIPRIFLLSSTEISLDLRALGEERLAPIQTRLGFDLSLRRLKNWMSVHSLAKVSQNGKVTGLLLIDRTDTPGALSEPPISPFSEIISLNQLV